MKNAQPPTLGANENKECHAMWTGLSYLTIISSNWEMLINQVQPVHPTLNYIISYMMY